MKKKSHHLSPSARFCATVLSLVSGLGTYGVLVMPAVAVAPPVMAATAPTTTPSAGMPASGTTTGVAQQPLNIPPPIPPDITLMLDDSGSMNWDVMPDYGTGGMDTSTEGLINAGVNGVYFNPTVTYSVPPEANGTDYPQAKFGAALVNGFDTTSTAVDLSTYRGNYDSYDDSYYGTPVQYSIAVAKTGATTYSPSSSCPTNTSMSGGAQPGYCYYSDQSAPPTGPVSFFDESNGYFYVNRCNSVSDIYNAASDTCTPGISFFTYTTGSSGSYVRHYVAENTGDCAAAGLSSSVCDESATTQKNVANWFSYYHTRILMSKSGLMTAFSTINPKFRVGYGSIDNGYTAGLVSPNGTFGTSPEIAQVAPFGKPADTTSQRINFWNWLIGEIPPHDSTPLRAALAQVGKYYASTQSTSHAWDWMSSDPGYAAKPSGAGDIACRQAYTILTTDGFWNGGYSDATTLHASDKAGPTFTPPTGQTYTGYTPIDPFQGGDATGIKGDATPSLADVAMYYWNHDLQSGINDEVVPNAQDPAYWQHMVTFTMGLGFTPVGITGTAPNGDNPPTTEDIFSWSNGGGGSGSKSAITNFAWPTPSAQNNGSINNIADLEHAGVNGHGGFFSATNPQTFASGIETALQRVNSELGSGASLGANSTKLDTGTYVYQSQYHSGIWTGDLLALKLDPSTGEPTTTSWAAGAALLNLTTPSPITPGVVTYAKRDIWTWSYSGGGAGQAVAFQVGSAGALPALSSTQLSALGSGAAAQASMINYLRGDNTNEATYGGTYRNRTTVLGDIVDSAPVYDGAPDATEFNGESFYGLAFQTQSGVSTSPFYTWATAQANRTGLIYVAANDGMLHIFNAASGQEVFAYLPGALMINSIDPATGTNEPLTNLSSPDYGSESMPHQDYNDGQLTVADAYFAEGTNAAAWHTILVGTTGRGPARAVYAIDVTDPNNIKPLWERYAGDGSTLDSNSGYIGEMTGKPIIAQTNATTTSSTWSVLMGNGYNSPKGRAALLQFNLATGQLSVYTTADTSTQNGLAGPYTWMDTPSDGVADVAYAGDLDGNVYQFTLNDSTGSNPCTSKCVTTLFTATDGNGNKQSITSQVMGAKNPTDGNLWLFFGTGKYLADSDVSSTSVQTWYGIIVTQGSTQLSVLEKNGRSALVQRQIIAEQAASGNTLAARAVTPAPSPPDITCKNQNSCVAGWYMDLVTPKTTTVDSNGNVTVTSTTTQGERMVYPDSLQGGLLIGTTIIPQPVDQPTDPCSPLGNGWIMAVDPFTGTDPGSNFFDTNGDNQVNNGDTIIVGGKPVSAAGVSFGAIPNAPIFVGGQAEISLGNGTVRHVGTGSGSGTYQRVSWRELVNP